MYERIKELMIIREIRYDKELEERAGVSQGTIKNIKNGHAPSYKTLTKIAEALQVPVDFLITGQADMDPNAEKRRKISAMLDNLSHDELEQASQYVQFLLSIRARDQADPK